MRNNLRSCRISKGFTMKQFAELLGITERQYLRIETGASDGSIRLWKKIKELLAQPIDYLVDETVN